MLDFFVWLAYPRSKLQQFVGSLLVLLIMLSPLALIGLGIWIGAYLGKHL